nr:hypothetical protein CFP56_30104 [Quercus suber]
MERGESGGFQIVTCNTRRRSTTTPALPPAIDILHLSSSSGLLRILSYSRSWATSYTCVETAPSQARLKLSLVRGLAVIPWP